MTAPKAPAGLGERGQDLWDSIVPTFQLKPDEVQVLIDACREADLIDRLHTALTEGSLISQGYNGQDVPAPTLSEIRQHRALLNTLLKSLKIPDTADSAARKSAMVSQQARSAVRQRWANAKGA